MGSLLVFLAFFIALYREGLSGWFFGVIGIIAAVFLISLAINPLYVIGGIAVVFLLIIFLNFYRIHWNVMSVASFLGSFLLLCGTCVRNSKNFRKDAETPT